MSERRHIKKEKALTDEVEQALYRRTQGYTVAVKKSYKLRRVEYDPDTGKKLCEYEELAQGLDEEIVPADLRAQVYWLNNRRPALWSDRPAPAETEPGESGVVLLPAVAETAEPAEDAGAD